MDGVTNLKAIFHDRNSFGASTGPCTAGLPEQKHQAISAFCSVKILCQQRRNTVFSFFSPEKVPSYLVCTVT